MSFLDDAYEELFKEKNRRHSLCVKYSGRLKDFNSKVSMSGENIEFHFSRKWKGIDKDIQAGLAQELLCKLFKKKERTMRIGLYRLFVKNMHLLSDKKESDGQLLESFNRVNESYFYGMLEQPNLRFGKESHRTLGSYNFHNDTITVTSLLKGAPDEMIDFIIYHELLHKKLQFDHNKDRTMHHTAEFRKKEKEFRDAEKVDKAIGCYIKKKRFPLRYRLRL